MVNAILFDYWRSSASYRVRIALNLAGIKYTPTNVDLTNNDHKSATHLALNPQGLVPVLNIDGQCLTQSLAIIEYIDETRNMQFLPTSPILRGKTRALAYCLAVDVHPVCNLSVVSYVGQLASKNNGREKWMRHFIEPGLAAFETMLSEFDQAPFCVGSKPSLADICLIPQVYNAQRWGVGMKNFPKITAISEACGKLPAFAQAHPEMVKPT